MGLWSNDREIDLAVTPTVALTSTVWGPMFYPRNDRFIGRSLQRTGDFCPLEGRILGLAVGTGATVVEVGANIGTFTVQLAKRVGPEGAVLALEPQRRLFDILCANLMLHDLVQVEPMLAAAGDGAGQVAFPQPPLDVPQHNYGGVGAGSADGPALSVRQYRVDDLAVARCDLLKIDAEGAEPAVLAGARQTIQRDRPIISAECDWIDQSAGWVGDLLEQDYRCAIMVPRMAVRSNWKRRDPGTLSQLWSFNLLALPGTLPDWAQDPGLGLQPVSSSEEFVSRMRLMQPSPP